MTARASLLAAFALAPLLAGFSLHRSEDRDVARGNELYRAGEYAEALAHYRAAAERVTAPELELNRGAALYRLAEASEGAERRNYLGEAARAFERAAVSGDRAVRAAAYHNVGNARYRQGRYQAAAEAYKAALRADPTSDDARHNLALALRARAQAAAVEGAQGAGAAGGLGRDRQPAAARPDEPAREPSARGAGEASAAGARGPDSRPGAERRDRTEPEPASLEDVERKLDELERLSREVWIERLRRRAERAARGEAPR